MAKVRNAAGMISAIERMRAEMLRMAAEDIPRFIRTFMQIEDKDAPGVRVPFKLWPEQIEVLTHLNAHRLTAILKARQLGLTWLVLAYAVCKMIEKHGYSIIGLSRTEDEAKELVRRVEVLLGSPAMGAIISPEHTKREGLPWFSVTALEVKIHYPDDLESTLKAFASASAAGRSYTANLLLLLATIERKSDALNVNTHSNSIPTSSQRWMTWTSCAKYSSMAIGHFGRALYSAVLHLSNRWSMATSG